ncbi:DUF4350 domain-containing protein [Nocardioides ginsengisoli]|uniref:DUF4350 domain-containing protein n=1 Tax=Nocardioides ginsengisoli TaxID=363868 RepID=UPI003387BCE7
MSADVGATATPDPAAPPAKGRPRRRLLVAGAVLLAVVVAIWASRGAERHGGFADPQNPTPDGAQALAQVLGDDGVDVTIVRSAADLDDTELGADATVVVTDTDLLAPSTLERLRGRADGARIVLVEPSYAVARTIESDVQTLPEKPQGAPVDCPGLPELDGLRLEVDSATSYDGRICHTVDDALVLFGAGQALTNDQITRADNAAVALRLLGHDRRLVWYVPDPADATSGDAVTLGSLLPAWIQPGLWLLGFALVALLLWRARRLGPLSVEPLPVVVRAVETARSRGRMYRRSGDRGHAARALRRAARDDLAGVLGLDRTAPTPAVVEATARQLGAPVESVAALLDDDRMPPANDQELVRLAQDLARLRREVRRA